MCFDNLSSCKDIISINITPDLPRTQTIPKNKNTSQNLSSPLEQIMTYNPLLPATQPKQLRTSQIKQPPIHIPLPSFPLPICLFQNSL
mmetsp:Transcript_10666/g.20069  ORF Transcript_10666/g.20069 Transcript_10666/m.20069 type:complete len:88 (+) Transcript_10666:14-277(+)